MVPDRPDVPGGILISLDTLIGHRSEQPAALDEAPTALRRIGWIGRPIVLVGERVADRELPPRPTDREAWVRAALGRGAYAVVPFEEVPADRPEGEGKATERWRALRDAQQGTWLMTNHPRQVGPARQAGLKVIMIGPADPQPRIRRADYQARDLRDAVGHLLAADVFGDPSPAAGGAQPGRLPLS